MSNRADAGDAKHRRIPRWFGVLGLLALLLIGIGSIRATAPSSPRSADAPLSDFSAARAMTHIEEIADAPRPVGSAKHLQAREYLLGRLTSWGWSTAVQEAVGTSPGIRGTGTQRIAAVANIIATMPGTASTGTVVLAAHYDTVIGAPGAADDGIGVATLLETARALSTTGAESPRNDIMILITDGEEEGLLGAEAFVRERAEALGTAVVLNHEARGVSGAPITFRTTSPNGTLLQVLSAAPGAFADSSSETVFGFLPHDTDFSQFSRAGMAGYDTAITAGSAFYHSPLDDPERLSPASLQQMGETSLAMTHALAGLDLARVADGGDEFVTTLPCGLLHYPRAAEIPLAVGTLVLAGVLVGLQRRRAPPRQHGVPLTLRRTALAAGAAIVVLAAAGCAAVVVWRVARRIDPGQASAVLEEPSRPGLYQVAVLLAGLGVVLALYAMLRRRLGADALAAGALLFLALTGALLSFLQPGVAAVLVLPTLPVTLGAVVATLLPERWEIGRVIVLVIALVPAVVLLGPGITATFDVGLNLGAPGSAIFLAQLLLLGLPLIEIAWPMRDGTGSRARARTAAVPALPLVLAAAVTAAGLFANREGATAPRQEMITYSVDTDTGTAYWASPINPRSDWSRALLSQPSAVLDDSFPWWDGSALAHGPAPVADLPAPELAIVTDATRDGTRELTLRLSSRRGAPALGLWVESDSATVRQATVAGRDVPPNWMPGKWNFGFLFDGAPADGIEVRLVLDQHTDDLTIRIADRSDDLHQVPGFDPPPAARVLVAPQVSVTRAVIL